MDMITENKVVPNLRFEEFNDSWENKKLLEVSIINMGQSPNSKSYNQIGQGMLLIQGNADIKNRLTNPRQWTSEPTKKCQIGDLILTVRAPVGAIAKSVHNACIGRGVCSISNNSKSNIEFLYQTLCNYEKKWVKLEQGSTFTAVSGKDIRGIILDIPSLTEQQKVASFLSAVDEKIQQLTKKKELLEDYKKGIMQKIFSQEIRFKDDNGNNYSDWEEKMLGEMIEIRSSKRVLQEHWKDFGVPFLRTREIKNLSNKVKFKTPIFISQLLFEELKEKYGIPIENDILVTGVGTIGELYIVKENDKFYFKDGNVLWFKMNSKLNSIYLSQLFKTRFVRKQLSDNASITTVATFTIDGARKTRIIYPCLKEQKKIADFLTAVDKKIEIVSHQLEKNKEFKKGLLQQMFV